MTVRITTPAAQTPKGSASVGRRGYQALSVGSTKVLDGHDRARWQRVRIDTRGLSTADCVPRATGSPSLGKC